MGQIAFEAYQQWMGFISAWHQQTPADQARWEHIGSAVAQAIAPIWTEHEDA